MLQAPGAFFHKGTALPGGWPRTLIVLGAARGGTTLVAQMLHDVGVFMGEGLGATCQDAALSQVSRALFAAEIGPDHPAIAELMRRRDRQFEVWGWKFPGQILPELYRQARNPHFVLVFRDPVAIATREARSQALETFPCFERASAQITALSAFAAAADEPCLIVSYERAMADKTGLADALAEFAGLVVAPEVKARAVERAQPGTAAYLDDTRPAAVEGIIDGVDKHIAGWLRRPHDPARKVAFTLAADGQSIHRGLADAFRADLQREFGHDGRFAFAVPTPRYLIDGKPHKITLSVSNETSVAIVHNDRYWTIAGEQ